MSYHGRFQKETQQKPKKKAGKITLSVILILVLLIIGAAVLGIRYYTICWGK